MKDILFWISLFGAILYFASSISIIVKTYNENRFDKIWLLKPVVLFFQGFCLLSLIGVCLMLYFNSKPQPEPKYEQITTPVYKLKE